MALHSCGAECQSLAAASQKAMFLEILLCEMGYQHMQATVIDEDNQSCTILATNRLMHKRSKHIDTRYLFSQEKVDHSSVLLVYTATDQLVANLMTKAHPQVKVEHCRKQLLGQMQILPQTNGKILVEVLKNRNNTNFLSYET